MRSCRASRHAPGHPPSAEAVGRTGYLADEGLATVAWLAAVMRRPLMLEGEPGTGKTALAEALAVALGAELIRLQCYEGIDASQALYDWDFPRQILHLRTVEATRSADADLDVASVEQSLFDERFLLERPVLRALRSPNAVLLVDEVDRADDEFEAFLLEVLSTNAVTVPELGTIVAEHPPLVVLTSNRTREVHDALKRRCLYHWVEHPGLAREVEILRTRLPEVPAGPGPAGGDRGAAAARGRRAARPGRPAQAARASPRAWTGPGACSNSVAGSSTSRPRRPRSVRCASTARTSSGCATPSTACSPG